MKTRELTLESLAADIRDRMGLEGKDLELATLTAAAIMAEMVESNAAARYFKRRVSETLN